MKCNAGAGDLLQDVACLGGPNEGIWVFVVAVDVVANSHDELFEVAEDTAPDAAFGQVAEESLHHVRPRAACGREVHVEADEG